MKKSLYKRLVVAVVLFSTLFFSCAQPDSDSKTNEDDSFSVRTEPVVTRTKAEVLAYITKLSDGTLEGVVSGQNSFHGDEITSENVLDGYKTMVQDLHTSSGKWVGMIGLDYEYQRVYSPAELKHANTRIINYWNEGGLITLNMSPVNPWTIDELDIEANPGNHTGTGSTRDFTDVNLADLIDSTTTVNAAWLRKLDRMAVALQELEDAGVVVLWRPMQEMNGNWFWWGMKSHPNDDGKLYKDVFRHMYDYFTNVKGLDNLLWVYSPNDSHGVDLFSGWNRPVNWAYPGDDVVDIVAGTVYSKDLTVTATDYTAYIALGKPLGLGEYGPNVMNAEKTNDGIENRTLDNRLYAEKLKTLYPKIAYWVSWHSFPEYGGDCWGILHNEKSTELMNDPYIITRDDIITEFTK